MHNILGSRQDEDPNKILNTYSPLIDMDYGIYNIYGY